MGKVESELEGEVFFIDETNINMTGDRELVLVNVISNRV